MNCTYRSIWNDTSGTFVAVSENARSAGRKTASGATAVAAGTRFGLQALAVAVMLSFGATSYALPTGGVVAAGDASISSTAGSTTITQTTQNASINWQSFGIGATEAVRFVQPNSSSVTLNRVLGSDPSSILGSLSANGKVFLVNPNGILFGQGASVNVGGLVASTLNITDSDFMAGSYRFSGSSGAALLNQGSINADGGYVALLGAKVSNEGVISARLGTVALAAGNAITLDVAGDGLLNVTVNQGAVNALVHNGGLLRADGGQVLLSAQSAGSLLQSAVNNTGVIRAQTLVTGEDGRIMLMGDMQSGTVNVGGTLDASAPNGGNGGFIETSAAYVKVADNVKITTAAPMGQTGTWLIDPEDFNVGSMPGDDITGAALSTQLGSNNVVIATVAGPGLENGDINVNEAVTWSAATTLTLNAFNDVNFNAAVTANTGSLVANAGRDINVALGVTGITATSGNISWTAGRDVNINSPVTTTSGDFTVCCGRDINVDAAVTTTDGDALLYAGRDINIRADMTMTRGHVVLRAGSEASAAVPGLIGGTVVFGPLGSYTVTGATPAITDIKIYYTPVSYNAPHDYSVNLTGTASTYLTQYMLVFAQGNDKVYDGNTTATLAFRGDPTLGGDVTLVPGTATFDDKNVAADIGITYTGYSLGGADAARFSLWESCRPGDARTSAAITPLAITGAITAADKDFDTTTAATITSRTLTGAINGDAVSYSGGSASFDTPTPGTNKTVTGSGLGLSGADAGNYSVNPTAFTTASIRPPIETLPVETLPVETLPVETDQLLDVTKDLRSPARPGAVPTWMPTVVLAKTPPELLALAPAQAPLVVVPAAAPVVAPVVVQQPAPVIVPIETPPEVYVAPVRPRKQDRN